VRWVKGSSKELLHPWISHSIRSTTEECCRYSITRRCDKARWVCDSLSRCSLQLEGYWLNLFWDSQRAQKQSKEGDRKGEKAVLYFTLCSYSSSSRTVLLRMSKCIPFYEYSDTTKSTSKLEESWERRVRETDERSDFVFPLYACTPRSFCSIMLVFVFDVINQSAGWGNRF